MRSEPHLNTKTQRQPFSSVLGSPGLRVAPSLLSADFSRLAEHIRLVEAAGAQVLHLDVMDGHFVPNISFGPPVISAIRPKTRMFFDAHLMIEDPATHAGAFVEAGCDHITFHIEAVKDAGSVIDHIRRLGASVGVSLNPDTSADAIRPFLSRVDLVLIMSVWPGFGGQSFIPPVLEKVRQCRELLTQRQRLEIDGGIDRSTIQVAARAGADTFVAGTAVFRADDPAEAFRMLQRTVESVSPGDRTPGG